MTAIVLSRSGVDNFCAIKAARRYPSVRATSTHPQAYVGSQWLVEDPASSAAYEEATARCVAENSTAAQEWAGGVANRFTAFRHHLSAMNRTWLELPYDAFVENVTGGQSQILRAAGLDWPCERFLMTCWMPRCNKHSWPVPASC